MNWLLAAIECLCNLWQQRADGRSTAWPVGGVVGWSVGGWVGGSVCGWVVLWEGRSLRRGSAALTGQPFIAQLAHTDNSSFSMLLLSLFCFSSWSGIEKEMRKAEM